MMWPASDRCIPLSSGKSRSFLSNKKSQRPTSGISTSGYSDFAGILLGLQSLSTRYVSSSRVSVVYSCSCCVNGMDNERRGSGRNRQFRRHQANSLPRGNVISECWPVTLLDKIDASAPFMSVPVPTRPPHEATRATGVGRPPRRRRFSGVRHAALHSIVCLRQHETIQ